MRAFAVLVIGLACVGARSQAFAEVTADVPSAFAPVSFLLGNWTGTGSAEGSPGSGSDRFELDLGRAVVIRRAHSTYVTGGKASGSYDGLMVIYPDAAAPAGLRADSFDSGGHVIRYDLVPSTMRGYAQFISVDVTERPTFRLTYAVHAGGMLDVTFEAAPPGSAAFAMVAHGVEQRAP